MGGATGLRRRTGCTATQLSDEENHRVYGKCNNPYGHGHNYVVEVSVSGTVDPATGMIVNLADLDRFVESEVLEAFDHKSLNEDVEAFRANVPTTENVCKEIYQRLKRFPLGQAGARSHRRNVQQRV